MEQQAQVKAQGISCPSCNFQTFKIAQAAGTIFFVCVNCAYTLQCGIAIAGPEIKKPGALNNA